ncbi:MAG: glutaredoxin [Lachnospiraceae bacterium]|nr:glutaredoxin [Lachnospiraceae bacterium]
MKFVMIGSHFCEDTLEALNTLSTKTVSYEFVDITGQPDGLKRFLNTRDNSSLFDAVRGQGIGIPYFRFEDGFETFDLNEVLARI